VCNVSQLMMLKGGYLHLPPPRHYRRYSEWAVPEKERGGNASLQENSKEGKDHGSGHERSPNRIAIKNPKKTGLVWGHRMGFGQSKRVSNTCPRKNNCQQLRKKNNGEGAREDAAYNYGRNYSSRKKKKREQPWT